MRRNTENSRERFSICPRLQLAASSFHVFESRREYARCHLGRGCLRLFEAAGISRRGAKIPNATRRKQSAVALSFFSTFLPIFMFVM